MLSVLLNGCVNRAKHTVRSSLAIQLEYIDLKNLKGLSASQI